jgi:sugar phosphate isomerase/epimerase
MHPRWASGTTLTSFLAPLRAAGLFGVEFDLWPNDPLWAITPQLMEDCRQLGLSTSFHAPYREPYTITGFATSHQARAEIIAAYATMFDIAAQFGSSIIVIHGAQSSIRAYHELRADTMAFLQWALARYPSLVFALENLSPSSQCTKVGTERGEVLEIVQEIDTPRLGICWDMGHDVLANRHTVPDKVWLQRVSHVHVHDIDEHRVDHRPLNYGQVPYHIWVPELVSIGFGGLIVLELKGDNWPEHLGNRYGQVLAESVSKIARLTTLH